MPVMNGLEIIEKVKGDNPASGLHTAYRLPWNRMLCFRLLKRSDNQVDNEPWKKAELER